MSDAYLKTAAKQFSQAVQPYELEVDSVTYDSGDKIEVTVIASPGLSSEEKYTFDITKRNPEELAWGGDHETFQLRIDLTAGSSTSPEVKSAVLKAFKDVQHKNWNNDGTAWNNATKNNIVVETSKFVLDQFGIPENVIDNYEVVFYEDQSLSLSDRYGGDLSGFSRQQTVVAEGSYALKSDTSGVISDTDHSLSQDTEYRVSVSTTPFSDDPWPHTIFFTQSETNNPGGYALQMRGSSDDVRLRSFDGGGGSTNETTTTSGALSEDTFYDLFFKRDSGTGDVTFGVVSDDQGNELSATASNLAQDYTSGGIGAERIRGTVYWDNFRIA